MYTEPEESEKRANEAAYDQWYGGNISASRGCEEEASDSNCIIPGPVTTSGRKPAYPMNPCMHVHVCVCYNSKAHAV